MKTSLSIHDRSYLCQLAIFAAFALLATTGAAQTYTITDLGTLGTNSLGSYSSGQCINASGQVAGESSASSSHTTDPPIVPSFTPLGKWSIWGRSVLITVSPMI